MAPMVDEVQQAGFAVCPHSCHKFCCFISLVIKPTVEVCWVEMLDPAIEGLFHFPHYLELLVLINVLHPPAVHSVLEEHYIQLVHSQLMSLMLDGWEHIQSHLDLPLILLQLRRRVCCKLLWVIW